MGRLFGCVAVPRGLREDEGSLRLERGSEVVVCGWDGGTATPCVHLFRRKGGAPGNFKLNLEIWDYGKI